MPTTRCAGRLARQLEARGALSAAGRLAGSEDAGARRAAARIAHLLPDERHVATLVPLVSDADPGSPAPRGARCAARAGRRSGGPRWRTWPSTARPAARRRAPLVERDVARGIGSAATWAHARPRRPPSPTPRKVSRPLRPPPERRSSSPRRALTRAASSASSGRSATPPSPASSRASSRAPPPPAPTRGPRRRSAAIQKELKRLGLYRARSTATAARSRTPGLTEAFGGEAWRSQTATEAHERLRAAERPEGAGGTRLQLRRAVPRRRARRHVRRRVLRGRPAGGGDAAGRPGRHRGARAARLHGGRRQGRRAARPRPAARCPTRPPAASSSRRTRSPTRRRPARRARSTRSCAWCSTTSPAAAATPPRHSARGWPSATPRWYSGHGRYGTGPDFDRNFIEFRLYDARRQARRRRSTTTRARGRAAQGGQGPVERLPAAHRATGRSRSTSPTPATSGSRRRPHGNEFGAKLIQWALEQSKAPLDTGGKGRLATTRPPNPQQRYRVLAFYGCSTNAYDAAMRSTEWLRHQGGRPAADQPRHPGRGGRRGLHGLPRRLRQPGLGREAARQHEHRDGASTRTASPATRGSSRGSRDNPGR